MSTTTRRTFLLSSVAAVPALRTLRAARAVETINVACIGTGGRCRHLMPSLSRIENVRIVALCDVWDNALADAKKLADKAAISKNYPEVLKRKDIHAVLIASPDHWHVPMTIDAVGAGKDVFVEKPLTHDLSEGKKVIEAVTKSKRVVQVGTQQRSMPHIIKAKEIVAAGKLGAVTRVRLSWNRKSNRVQRFKGTVKPESVDWKGFLGNAPKQDFDDYRFRNWRWFWDFGGGIFTDLMVHWIDVAHWLLDVDMPKQAVSIGSHHNSKGVWETPDTVQTLLTYKGDIQAHFEGTFSNSHMGARIEFLGTDASLYIDRGRYELLPQPGSKVKKDEQNLGGDPRGADFYKNPDGELLHLQNWVDAIRNGRQPSAPIEAGVSAAAAAHLGNQAYRENRVAVWKG
jgi:predicted dehydrogenase